MRKLFKPSSELTPGMRKKNALLSVISAFLILGTGSEALADIPASFDCFKANVVASWYGRAEYVRVAADKVLNHNQLFAASRTLPLGTKLVVKNLANGRTVVVTVLDRGPYVSGRQIDMSYGAAKQLGMIEAGLTRVEIMPYQCYIAEKNDRLFYAKLFNDISVKPIALLSTDTKACVYPSEPVMLLKANNTFACSVTSSFEVG